ncbi:hypothetical protein PCH_Pc15g01050 [Penicillium rubens Wisconsin 54-1255]|uniref:Uncharacterized protein n=1 Tax=Penicillium rubens (strain ATCC 28089 / DSM 1075 / NRRL 1951 / Wisconsin 54-1255) TaxID=500485 RepID=B6H6P9_PENRW|nr:hypothetical protein PCH_Pc15g01050 [Penicillium rubens Wisconsin 54-1255]
MTLAYSELSSTTEGIFSLNFSPASVQRVDAAPVAAKNPPLYGAATSRLRLGPGNKAGSILPLRGLKLSLVLEPIDGMLFGINPSCFVTSTIDDKVSRPHRDVANAGSWAFAVASAATLRSFQQNRSSKTSLLILMAMRMNL